jgi:pimeloyl-ACP methyl ester carboxylesterase
MKVLSTVMTFLFAVSVVPTALFAAPEIQWKDCPGAYGPGFDCGALDVPLDYDYPDGQTIAIELVRLPAANPQSRLGTIFLNPGGPGGSGVFFVLDVGSSLFSDEVRARFDIIGFDPRGIHRSEPLQCFPTPWKASSISTLSWPFPLTSEEQLARQKADNQLALACEQNGGEILHHMSTVDVARDLDLLRQAVGDEYLNYAGYSYGSFLGNVYANLFPDRVRAVVIDAVVDPIAWTTGRGLEAMWLPLFTRLRSDAGAQATLDEFFRLCDEAGPNACAFTPNSSARFDDLAEQLLKEPIKIVLPSGGEVVLFAYPDLIGVALNSMYDSSTWPDFAVLLSFFERRTSAEALGAALQAVRTRGGARDDDIQTSYPNQVEGYPGVACSDSINPITYLAWPRAAAIADENYGYFGSWWTWASSICQPWAGPVAHAYIGPFDHQTANPVLVVGTRYDPATRYENAALVSDLLPNSTLLTLEGWGHTTLFLSACVDEAVSQYFLTGAPPPDGTVCNQDFKPFDTSAFAVGAQAPDGDPAAVAKKLRAKALREVVMPLHR